jgi:hypothetical protein
MSESGNDSAEQASGQETEVPADVEAERRERLDPDNRPDRAEVDNTDRDFDVEKGMFTDHEGYEQAENKFPAVGEQGA